MLKYFNDGISFEYIYLCVCPLVDAQGVAPLLHDFFEHII